MDDGKEWIKINSNLPVVPVNDIAIRDNSIVLATHGRSFWILDDITAIQQLNNKSENIIKILILLMTANISPGFGILLGLFNFIIKKV